MIRAVFKLVYNKCKLQQCQGDKAEDSRCAAAGARSPDYRYWFVH
jgi:hypothetical protein